MPEIDTPIQRLKAFFSIPGRPVETKEFMEFWKSCSDEDKAYFKSCVA